MCGWWREEQRQGWRDLAGNISIPHVRVSWMCELAWLANTACQRCIQPLHQRPAMCNPPTSQAEQAAEAAVLQRPASACRGVYGARPSQTVGFWRLHDPSPQAAQQGKSRNRAHACPPRFVRREDWQAPNRTPAAHHVLHGSLSSTSWPATGATERLATVSHHSRGTRHCSALWGRRQPRGRTNSNGNSDTACAEDAITGSKCSRRLSRLLTSSLTEALPGCKQ